MINYYYNYIMKLPLSSGVLNDISAVDRVRTADPVDGRCGGRRRLDPQTP